MSNSSKTKMANMKVTDHDNHLIFEFSSQGIPSDFIQSMHALSPQMSTYIGTNNFDIYPNNAKRINKKILVIVNKKDIYKQN